MKTPINIKLLIIITFIFGIISFIYEIIDDIYLNKIFEKNQKHNKDFIWIILMFIILLISLIISVYNY
jgi:H+/Cl- antiporter ClcA